MASLVIGWSVLLAGYDAAASGMTLDRFCDDGITSVSFAAAQIMSGMEDVIIAGGTEMISHHQELDIWEAGTPLGELGRARGNFSLYDAQPMSHVALPLTQSLRKRA